MRIGVPKETKIGEARVGLLPEYVKKLVSEGHDIFVESGLGTLAGIPDSEYQQAGATLTDKKGLARLEMIVRVKEPPLEYIQKGQTIMGFLHIEKGQNPTLLKRLIEQQTTAIALEEIRDKCGFRRINLGCIAGEEGMSLALSIYKERTSGLKKTNPAKRPVVYILGYGNAGRGAYDVARAEGCRISFLADYELKKVGIEKYIKRADILVNALVWRPGMPHIVTRDMLKSFKPGAIICDISCDEKGAIETCRPTTLKDPSYEVDGVLHTCVDNLPSRNPVRASRSLNRMSFPYVLQVASGNLPDTGLMVLRGQQNFNVSGSVISYRHNNLDIDMV